MESNSTKQQLLRFLVTGVLAVSTDFCAYWLMIGNVPVDIAKGLSFVCGSAVAFVMNKLWTFEHNSTASNSILHFSSLYGLTFLANVSVNHITIIFVPEIKLLGFVLATATSTVLNFLGMKYWVFSKHRHQVGS
ncbi:MAG: putative flippase GtrA [Crocinitomicaceae bacterium]|jgi:putative flippase GtrA